MWAASRSTATSTTSSPRPSRYHQTHPIHPKRPLRHAPRCCMLEAHKVRRWRFARSTWCRASTSPTTRCCRAATSPTWTPSSRASAAPTSWRYVRFHLLSVLLSLSLSFARSLSLLSPLCYFSISAQLPISSCTAINRPTCPVMNNQRDGFMRQRISKGRVNYHPNRTGCPALATAAQVRPCVPLCDMCACACVVSVHV